MSDEEAIAVTWYGVFVASAAKTSHWPTVRLPR